MDILLISPILEVTCNYEQIKPSKVYLYPMVENGHSLMIHYITSFCQFDNIMVVSQLKSYILNTLRQQTDFDEYYMFFPLFAARRIDWV